MSRSEILEEIDPEWRERYRGDVDLAWNFYYQYAREEIERVKRERGMKTYRIALFKNTRWPDSAAHPAMHLEGTEDYARVSEFVEITFPPLSDEVVVKQQLDALDRTEQELRAKFQQHLDGIKQRRAELQAITYKPAA